MAWRTGSSRKVLNSQGGRLRRLSVECGSVLPLELTAVVAAQSSRMSGSRGPSRQAAEKKEGGAAACTPFVAGPLVFAAGLPTALRRSQNSQTNPSVGDRGFSNSIFAIQSAQNATDLSASRSANSELRVGAPPVTREAASGGVRLPATIDIDMVDRRKSLHRDGRFRQDAENEDATRSGTHRVRNDEVAAAGLCDKLAD
mmetsp:Transcript_21394/g.63331  ORF Transcript_21394/g.63331 Transcript_21394/m.63331 type:complete len:200 (-) Transcript_21394:1069-1668(-)